MNLAQEKQFFYTLQYFQDFWLEKEPDSQIQTNSTNGTFIIVRKTFPKYCHVFYDFGRFEFAIGGGMLDTTMIHNQSVAMNFEKFHDCKEELLEVLFAAVKTLESQQQNISQKLRELLND